MRTIFPSEILGNLVGVQESNPQLPVSVLEGLESRERNGWPQTTGLEIQQARDVTQRLL